MLKTLGTTEQNVKIKYTHPPIRYKHPDKEVDKLLKHAAYKELYSRGDGVVIYRKH